MEIRLISLEEIKQLKKQRRSYWAFILGTFLLLGIFAVLAYCFQNRSTQVFWIIGGTLLTSLWLIVTGFVALKMLSPLKHYLRFSVKALSSTRQISQVKIGFLSSEDETYRGFLTRGIEGKEVDELTLLRYRYEATAALSLSKGHVYEIESYDDVIVRVKEKS